MSLESGHPWGPRAAPTWHRRRLRRAGSLGHSLLPELIMVVPKKLASLSDDWRPSTRTSSRARGGSEAKNSGVWVFGGGLHSHEEVSVVATDGTVSDGSYPESKAYIGGFAVVDVSSREEALEWAAKIAVACRCAQDKTWQRRSLEDWRPKTVPGQLAIAAASVPE